MAQTEHLLIYKAAYDLCLYLEQVVHQFSRYHKYTLGADLRDSAGRALRLVVRANARRDRAPVLLELREELEELKVLLRLGQDVKAFVNFNSFEHAITQVVEIAKQNEGWLKSQGQGQGQNWRAMRGGGEKVTDLFCSLATSPLNPPALTPVPGGSAGAAFRSAAGDGVPSRLPDTPAGSRARAPRWPPERALSTTHRGGR
jgi:hypothetical protein